MIDRPDLAAIRANWALGTGTYTNLHAARAATVNLLLDYAEALERERDAFRAALLPFARAEKGAGSSLRLPPGAINWIEIVVDEQSLETARALVGGEAEA